MDSYIDIKIIPDDKMSQNVLLNEVFTKLHKTLYDLSANDIGVSFPGHKVILGDTLRIHGKMNRIKELQEIKWLGALSGNCKQSDILEVPLLNNHGYQKIYRVQQNKTNAKLRRLIKRGFIADESINEYKQNMLKEGLVEPYLELRSASNGHKYRCYIRFGKIEKHLTLGDFDAFGLSNVATVPIF